VQRGLEAARRAGKRPQPRPRIGPAPRDWVTVQLEGTGITMIGNYRSEKEKVEFQCSIGHVFLEFPVLVVDRNSCPCCVDWGWTKGPNVGLRASLR